MTLKPCPCGSEQPFENCCEPILQGSRPAETPVALMRSRYTAFVEENLDHLYTSLHPKEREKYDEETTKEWARQSEWLGLEVREVEAGGADDQVGFVEFLARYKTDVGEFDHHERAEFRRHEGDWYYWDGKIFGGEPIRREEPKVGRNDPCPCGSGKKFKKCCANA